MTEFLVVMATALAAFLFIDPFFNGALAISSLAKSAVLIVCMGTLIFHLVGRWVVAPARVGSAVREMASAWWSVLLLSTLIITGSAYARFIDNVGQSFIGMGLGMLFLPLVAVAVRASDISMVFMKGVAAVYLMMVLTMIGLMAGTDHLFHESIFVAVPLGAYFLCANKPKVWQIGLGLLLMAGAALSVKNTTFLMLLTTLAACLMIGAVRIYRRTDRFTAVVTLYFGVLLAAACAAALLFVWLNYRSKLPSGNVEYRVEMYGIAWRRFLDSPIWGTGFTGSSVNLFRLYKVAQGTQDLPTHSDILDILAHGGLIGIALWLAFVWRLLVIGWDVVRKLAGAVEGSDMQGWRCLFVLFLMQINAIVTYSVNPPLINPVFGFWIWGGTGIMWALHRSLTHPIKTARRFAPQMGSKAAWA